MNAFFTIASLLGVNMGDHSTGIDTAVEQAFIQHLSMTGESFETKEEYAFRLNEFSKKDKLYKEINANPENTFLVGHNDFSTWTDAEYMLTLGYTPFNKGKMNVEQKVFSPEEVEVMLGDKDNMDWRNLKAVTKAKNQGKCGSCWMFGAVGAIEGRYAWKHKYLHSFSEQQLLDCINNLGCNGGLAEDGFNYLKSAKLMKDSDYPYTATRASCKANASKGIAEVTSWA